MCVMKRLVGFFLVLSFYTQFFSLVFAIDKTNVEKEQSRIEAISEKIFFKKFNRQFDYFKSEINELIIFESDDSLNLFFNELIAYIEQQGHYALAEILRGELENGSGTVRTILTEMTNEETRLRTQEALRVLITEAGGLKAYLKNVKIHKKNNLDLKCRIKKIALITLIAPLTLFGLNSGIAVATYLSAGIINSYVLIMTTGTAIAAFGTYGWVHDRLSQGCYYGTDNENYIDSFIK